VEHEFCDEDLICVGTWYLKLIISHERMHIVAGIENSVAREPVFLFRKGPACQQVTPLSRLQWKLTPNAHPKLVRDVAEWNVCFSLPRRDFVARTSL
jgi:hypothetical protein